MLSWSHTSLRQPRWCQFLRFEPRLHLLHLIHALTRLDHPVTVQAATIIEDNGAYLAKNKVSLQTSLERNSSNFSYISFLGVNFENLTVEFHVPYVLNIYIKFRSDRILFTIWSINLFFIYNFRLQKLEIITFIWWHSNWSLIFLKFCKYYGCNKNMQYNG